MANREDLAIIRAARAEKAAAQLTLGKRYLFGGNGLPQSPDCIPLAGAGRTAGQADAWMLIAQHIPYEVVLQLARPHEAAQWYERAFDDGFTRAGLVLADWCWSIRPARPLPAPNRRRMPCVRWKWWRRGQCRCPVAAGAPGRGMPAPEATAVALKPGQLQQWTQKAADAGIEQAQHALADSAWRQSDATAFRSAPNPWPMPCCVNTAGMVQLNALRGAGRCLGQQNILLLRRLAQVHLDDKRPDLPQAQQLLELAALACDRDAQLALGLLYGRVDESGARRFAGQGSANYKKAIRWLTLAGEQGMAAAWYVLSRIYLKPEFSQRNLADVQHYLERAAEMGHVEAQVVWRGRLAQPAR
jgi:TPR repeat protein